MKKAFPALLATLLLASVARGQSVQTLFSFPGSEADGLAIDLADNTFYTLWQGQSVDPVVAYDRYFNWISRSVEAVDSPFVAPSSATVARGGIVVADLGLSQLQWVDRLCGTVSNLCDVQFSAPVAVTSDAFGNLYVADANGVYKLDVSNRVTTLGTGWVQPGGVAVDDAGQVWVSDSSSDVIKLIRINGSNVTVTVVAGKAGATGYADSSKGANARFNSPGALFWAGGQTGLLIADYGNNAIRNLGYNAACDCYGVGTIATGFNGPAAIAIDNEGTINVADSKSGSVRSVSRSAQPLPAILPPTGNYSNAVTATFSTTLLSGFSPTFHYTLNGAQPTKVTSSGTSVTFDGALGQDASRILRMRCFSPDLATSAEVSNAYSFFVNLPVSTPAGATTNNAVAVTISNATAGASLYWTLDGSEPSPTNGSLYSGPFLVASKGFLNVKGFKPGYANSVTLSQPFNLFVADPVISPTNDASANDIQVTISCVTTNAQVYFTTDGADPTPASTLYTGPFMVSRSGTLKTKAFRDGFDPSQIVSKSYVLTVADPVIRPQGGTNDNPLQVTLSTATAGASLFWTVDGSEPTPASTPAVNNVPFTLAKTGTLTVKAFKDGYTSSADVSAGFNFFVNSPQVVPGSLQAINSTPVSMGVTTAGSVLHYTLDGTTPTANSPVYSGPLTITNTTTVSVIAMRDGFTPSPVVIDSYQIQVDAPVMNPPGGYFPDGGLVSLSVQRPDASIYYTFNGQDPTPSDTFYTGPFKVDQVLISGDLRIIKARAFAPGTLPSAVVSGRNVQTNSVGVPRDIVGGIGSTLVVPVVANLVTNQQIRSLQFRLEVTPSSPGAPPISDDLAAVSTSTNDFVPIISGSTDGKPVTNFYQPYFTGYTNGVVFYSVAGNMLLRDFGLVSNFKIKVPNTALEGDTYTVSVLQVSGTSDAGQTISSIAALPPRTLTVKNIPWLAGDSAIGGWYNAGDFGDGNLDNADVNTAIDAALGLHVPYPFSDAFKAMDVYPEAPGIIGDGLITYLDWQHILARSLHRETNNWIRFWTVGGVLGHQAVASPDSLNLRASPEALLADATPVVPQNFAQTTNSVNSATNCQWLRHALIVAESVTNLAPGANCSMRVYAKVLPGYSLAGLQFRAVCTPEGDAPAPASVRFVAAGGMPSPMAHALASATEAACIWPLDSFLKPMQGSNLLGAINFQIPANARAGQSYSVQLIAPDGAADNQTGLSLESATGYAWVLSGPAVMPHVVSDQWKTNFFGTVKTKDSDEDADPDQDGIPNWQEYLAGTNPTNALSRLEFSTAGMQKGRIVVGWQGVPGRVYVVECSSALFGAPWTPVSTNVCAEGDSGVMNGTFLTGNSQFYRIRLQQP